MELDQVMAQRRSIRAYQENRKVDRADVEAVLKAATLAPSWKNSQTARYYVAMSEEMVKAVREQGLPEFNRKSSAGAPVYIVATFVKNRSGYTREGEPENEVGNGWGCYDLGLQTQNLVLKAAELGLGTLIMGIRDAEGLRKVMGIPEEEEVMAVIALGYPDIQPAMPKRKELDQIAKFL